MNVSGIKDIATLILSLIAVMSSVGGAVVYVAVDPFVVWADERHAPAALVSQVSANSLAVAQLIKRFDRSEKHYIETNLIHIRREWCQAKPEAKLLHLKRYNQVNEEYGDLTGQRYPVHNCDEI